MIVDCIAVPYRMMQEYKSRLEKSELGLLAKAYPRVWIVSITDPEVPPLFREMSDVLPLQFHDVDADKYDPQNIELLTSTYNRDPDEDPEQKPLTIFSPEQALQVVQFIMRAHANHEERPDLFVANCMAGVKRSGAIVDFARTACGVPYERFMRFNRKITPNSFIRRLLFEAWVEEKTKPVDHS